MDPNEKIAVMTGAGKRAGAPFSSALLRGHGLCKSTRQTEFFGTRGIGRELPSRCHGFYRSNIDLFVGG